VKVARFAPVDVGFNVGRCAISTIYSFHKDIHYLMSSFLTSQWPLRRFVAEKAFS